MDANALLKGIHDREPVAGLTHAFYRYPARFSPSFARAIITQFTQPGDVVLDPFMGGSTTLVEASALGRTAIGTDINSLAVFLAKVKTRKLSEAALKRLQTWFTRLPARLKLHQSLGRLSEASDYQRNLNGRTTWPIRKTVELALSWIDELDDPALLAFARCVLLRTAQWALDCRIEVPSAQNVRERLLVHASEMIDGAREYRQSVQEASRMLEQKCETRCLHRSAIGLQLDPVLRGISSPSLIITSPPYPGVHILYHRWQILGRRETPAPYWIAPTSAAHPTRPWFSHCIPSR